MIGVVTDSSSQLSQCRAKRAGIDVVPQTVVLGGEERLEGVDLDADEFYAHLAEDGAAATTSLPSPGRLRSHYDGLLARGVEEIISVHVAASVSGTVGAARLAAEGLPVRVVDTGQASYGVAVCAVAAASVVEAGGSSDDAVGVARKLGGAIGNAFVAGGAGGRRIPVCDVRVGQPILSFADGATVVLDDVPPERAIDALVAAARAAASPVHVAVGASDAASFPFADELAERLGAERQVVEVDRYRVGPSVGAHTGPGTYGLFWWPAAAIRASA
jgi:fatty acid kinase fatty acid binding subunit